MSDIVSGIFGGFSETIVHLANGCKEAFTTFFYNTAEGGTSVISEPAQFFLTMLGIGIAMGLTLGCVTLVRRKLRF